MLNLFWLHIFAFKNWDAIQHQTVWGVLMVFKIVWCQGFQDCLFVFKLFKKKNKRHQKEKKYRNIIEHVFRFQEREKKAGNLLFKKEIQTVW